MGEIPNSTPHWLGLAPASRRKLSNYHVTHSERVILSDFVRFCFRIRENAVSERIGRLTGIVAAVLKP
jgi:hypothetical protein